MQAEVAKKVIRPVVFYEGEFPSGTIYLWSGTRPVKWDGKTWTGLGQLVGVSPVTESAGGRADGLICTLSGIPNSLLTKALDEVRHADKGTLWFGTLDANGVVVVDPTRMFVGRADVAVVKKGRKTSTIAVTYETRAIDRRSRERRFTHEDQQIDYAGDLGFAYVNALQDKNLSTGTGSGPSAGGSSGGGAGDAEPIFTRVSRLANG